MENMKQVVNAKIKAKLQKGYKNAVDATTRLQEEGKVAMELQEIAGDLFNRVKV